MAIRTAQGRFNDTLANRTDLTTEKTASQRKGRGIFGASQSSVGEATVVNGNLVWGQGATWLNPMNFPGWESLYTGTYPTYRWILQHPVVRLARSIATISITASSWEYGKTDDAPQAWVDTVKAQMDRLRPDLMADFFVRGKDFGWAGGEPIWSYDASTNTYCMERVKPLLPESTEILEDNPGNFVGLRNHIPRDDSGRTFVDLRAPLKAWIYTYDSEAGYKYGRSWIENIRSTAFIGWMRCAQELKKLAAKISGVISIVVSPAGTFDGPIDLSTGKPKQISFQASAVQAIKDLANGAAGAWFPSIGLSPDARGGLDAIKVMAQLVGKSLTNWQIMDFGNHAAAITGILEEMKHHEELILNGALRSARVALEAKHGTKEEAGTHLDVGTQCAEEEDRHFARGCQPLVNAILLANHTPNAQNKVWIKPPSLVDRKTEVVRAVVLALINNQDLAKAIGTGLELGQSFQALGIPVKPNFDFAAELQKQLKEAQTANAPGATAPGANQPRRKNPSPEGGRPAQTGRLGRRAVLAA